MTIRLFPLLFLCMLLGLQAQACPIGFFGVACNVTAEDCAIQRCSGHGVCTSATEGCECDVFYYNQSSCNLNRTQCRTAVCQDRGECTLTAGVCACDSNFFADTQCTACVTGFEYESNCTRCSTGYYGPTCSWNATECGVYQCFGHGLCTAADTNQTECVCQAAWNASSTCGQSSCSPGQSTPSADGSVCECIAPYETDPLHPTRCRLACSFPHGFLIPGNTCLCAPSRPGPWCRDVYVSIPVLMLAIISTSVLGLRWLF